MKRCRGFMSHDTVEGWKVWRKTDSWWKNNMRNLDDFNGISLLFDVLLLSIAYKVSAKYRIILSWNWWMIQTLKKNWLFVWKMTWGIWWILTRAAESLKIFMSHFYRKKLCYVSAKKQRSCVVKNDLWLPKWHMELKVSSWK